MAQRSPGSFLVLLSERDNVATALQPIPAGTAVTITLGQARLQVLVRQTIPFGHKVAVSAIPAGEPVIKYGYPIGSASQPIDPGEHVHTHNLESDRGRGDRGVTGSPHGGENPPHQGGAG